MMVQETQYGTSSAMDVRSTCENVPKLGDLTVDHQISGDKIGAPSIADDTCSTHNIDTDSSRDGLECLSELSRSRDDFSDRLGGSRETFDSKENLSTNVGSSHFTNEQESTSNSFTLGNTAQNRLMEELSGHQRKSEKVYRSRDSLGERGVISDAAAQFSEGRKQDKSEELVKVLTSGDTATIKECVEMSDEMHAVHDTSARGLGAEERHETIVREDVSDQVSAIIAEGARNISSEMNDESVRIKEIVESSAKEITNERSEEIKKAVKMSPKKDGNFAETDKIAGETSKEIEQAMEICHEKDEECAGLNVADGNHITSGASRGYPEEDDNVTKVLKVVDGSPKKVGITSESITKVGVSEVSVDTGKRGDRQEGKTEAVGTKVKSTKPVSGTGPPSIVLQQVDQDVCSELEALHSPRSAVKSSKLQLKLHPANGTIAPARKSPVTVQEWVDSLPAPIQRSEDEGDEQPLEDAEDVLDLDLGAEAGLLYDVGCPAVTIISPQPSRTSPSVDISKVSRREGLAREPSVQSDVTSHGSHGSSVESYLESRKPDPEEVLLSLGFGGPSTALDSEVSRIPRRFLQPSKVRGVAIKDFLRYQQDLIETFETGFCGYRGLTGSSHSMPSVIVAKIMEKLREHERESCSGTCDHVSMSASAPPASSPPESNRRFSNMARRVLKRTSVLGAITSKQPATLSVLNADNRRFLENQGNKSPEVPRKRMIIGHRSFTFGCDGEMIEVENSVQHTSSPREAHPLPKPLIHKDSILSSATSLSLTSVDSDSDTDDRSGSYDLRRRLRMPVTPGTSTETCPQSSTPYSDIQSLPISSCKSVGMVLDLGADSTQTGKFSHSGIGKRMSSTSLSSWESESPSVESPVSRLRFCNNEDHGDEMKPRPMRSPARFYLPSASPDSPQGNRPVRYESIDEDVEMRTESDVSKESDSNELSASVTNSSPSSDDRNIAENVKVEMEKRCSKYETDDCVFMNSVAVSCLPRVSSVDEAATQGRRGSLKRQQHIAEEEAMEILQSVCSGEENNEAQAPVLLSDDVKEKSDILKVEIMEHEVNNNVPQSLLSDVSCLQEETVQHAGNSLKTGQHLKVNNEQRGDSFEMEEIGPTEEEGRLASLSRARSDSSGFLEGDPGEHSPSNNSESRDAGGSTTKMDDTPTACTNIRAAKLKKGKGWHSKNCEPAGKDAVGSYVKRLSLPVVRVHDELGSVLYSRSNSLHSLGSSSSSSTAGMDWSHQQRRRFHSAPNVLSLGGSCSSVSNMFSSCSDESVIHVGVQSGGTASSDSLTRNRDLQELLDELAGRGVNLSTGLDSPQLPCHANSQLSPLQTDAVRLALGTYGSQLVGGMSNLQVPPELLDCGPEAQRELQIVRDIREQIAAELRRVAALLEEQPGPRAVAITRQMTALLREQTRLCRQLEALSKGARDSPLQVEPTTTATSPFLCCNSERLLAVVREENRRLEQLVQGHSLELTEIRQLLRQLVAIQK